MEKPFDIAERAFGFTIAVLDLSEAIPTKRMKLALRSPVYPLLVESEEIKKVLGSVASRTRRTATVTRV